MEPVKLCKRGHERTPENVNKWGACLACKLAASAEWSKSRSAEQVARDLVSSKAWRDKNKQQIKEARKLKPVTEKQREKHRESQRRWVDKNPIKVAEMNKGYRDNNRGRNADLRRAWVAANKDKVKAMSRKQTQSLTDAIVAEYLKMSVADAPAELIEIKRLTIQLQRSLKNVHQI